MQTRHKLPFYRLGGWAAVTVGAFWVIIAASILLTGYQLPFLFELGQALFAVGVLGFYTLLSKLGKLAQTGTELTVVVISARMFASVYELLPGTILSTGTSFVLPHSLMVAIGPSGALIGLPLLAFALLQAHIFPFWWIYIPILGALSMMPIAITALIYIEAPIY